MRALLALSLTAGLAAGAAPRALAAAGPPADAAQEDSAGAPAAPAQDELGEPSEADLERQERLRRAFARVPAMRELTVRVAGDVVTLGGRSASPAVREQAVEIARRLEDVLYVDDRIEVALQAPPAHRRAESDGPSAVDEQLERRLTGILSQVEALDNVEVTVQAGVVRLEGETTSEALREQAAELARAQEGAAFVVNDIVLTADVGQRLTPGLGKILERFREWLAAAPLLLVALAILSLAWGLGWLLGRVPWVWRGVTRNRLLQDLLRQTVRVVVLLVGVFLALELLGATALVGGVLGTAGIVGLAIGFAFRDIAENYLASIILSVRRPFRGNDLVRIGEHLGTVIRLSASDTVLMAPDGNHLHLPNAMVFKSSILNYTRNPLRRFDLVAGVAPEADLAAAQSVGVEILAAMPGVVADPRPFARVEALGDSSVAVRWFGWVDQTRADFGKVHSEAIRLVKAALEGHGIRLPEPLQRVRLERARDDGPAPPRPAEQAQEARGVDVSLQDDLAEQLARDRRASGEKDLLED